MFARIKKFFITAFCILLISTIWAISLAGSVEGGAGLNGFVAFILWGISVYIAVKVNAVAAVIGSFALELILHTMKYGMNEKMMVSIFAIAAVFLLLWKFDSIWNFLWDSLFGKSVAHKDTGEYKERKTVRKHQPQIENSEGWEEPVINIPEEDREERKKEFYNIRNKEHSVDCPYIFRQSSEGGKEPFYCGMQERDISSNEYYHLCAYDWTAREKCPTRKKYSKYN